MLALFVVCILLFPAVVIAAIVFACTDRMRRTNHDVRSPYGHAVDAASERRPPVPGQIYQNSLGTFQFGDDGHWKKVGQ
jgi:hypothetical protein